MSFPRYARHKNSTVLELGSVPEHWKIAPLKAVSTYNDDVLDEATPPNAEIIYVDISSVEATKGITAYEPMQFSVAPSRARRRVKDGDVIVSTVRTYLRAIAPIREPEENLIVSTGFVVIRPRNELKAGFLSYLLSSVYFIDQVIARSAGVSYPAINAREVVAIPVAVPPLAEQVQIATFLDRETSKIDELVAEQQRLIELLKEKRQAVISHAVTKGLNPDAPMKPSGIEWLGQVPDAWRIMPLKRLVERDSSISYGIVQPGPPLEDGVPFVQTTNMSTGDFELANLQRTTAAIAAQYPRSLLVGGEVILGIRASIGAAHVVPLHLAGANLSRGVARIVPNSNISSEYLVAYFGTNAVSTFWQLSKQGSTFNEVSIETVRELPVCVPCSDEQAKIVCYLDVELKRYGALTVEASRSVELLQERRRALISAAVTGKIDVRKLAERKAA